MDETTKHKIVEHIMQSNDDVLLNEIQAMLELSDKDFWDELSDETRASIDRGLEDIKKGRTKANEEVLSDIQKRFLS